MSASKSGRQRQRSKARSPRPGQSRWLWLIVGVVVVVGAALVVATVAGRSDSSSKAKAASGAVVRDVTSVPAATTEKVGTGGVEKLPTPISAPALTRDGKPLVLYIGAEYCPYCAAERWALVQALSRFGKFVGLKATESSSTDVFPSTPTFSFHGSTYTSPYVAFEGVEQQGNELSGGQYPVLEKATAEQQQILTEFDAPPYVPAASTGAIPFIDFGGQYLISGSSYSPQLLAGKSHSEIAAALKNPDDPIAQAILGTANGMTAAICSLTDQQPADVCDTPTIRNVQSSISK